MHLAAVDSGLNILPTGSLPLMQTTTNSSGQFTLDTTGCCVSSLSTLQSLSAGHAGDVEFELWGVTSDSGLIVTDFPATLLTMKPNEPSFIPKSGNLTVSAMQLQVGRGLVSTVSTPGNPGPFLADDPNPFAGQATVDATTYDGEGEYSQDPATIEVGSDASGVLNHCVNDLGGYLTWKQAAHLRVQRYVPVQKLLTRGKSAAKYDLNKSTSTLVGIALEGQYGYFGVGVGHSTTESTSMGVEWGWIENYTTKAALLSWWENRLRAFCNDQSGFGGVWLSEWKWVPDSWQGSWIYGSATEPWICNPTYKSTGSGPAYVARLTTEKWEGGFSIGPVSLNSWQTDSSTESLWFTPYASSDMYLCGSNSSWYTANYVKEVDTP